MKKTWHVILTLVMLCAFKFADAQTKRIVVFAFDQRNEPLESVNLLIKRIANNKSIYNRSVRSGDSISMPMMDSLEIIGSFAGKQPFRSRLLVSDTLTSMMMRFVDADLQAITVVSKKTWIREEDDKTIVDATALSNSSTNAMEVLEKTPGAIIDQDGNVYLNSLNPAAIQINGRTMRFSASDLSALLKSLPANSVEKIEILRNPSVKYDAASSGGIVNIILKKGVRIGSNGSLNVSHFQGVNGTTSFGGTISSQQDKLNSYANYQYTSRNAFEQLQSERRFTNDNFSFEQLSYTSYPNRGHYLNGGIDWSATEKWKFTMDTRINYSNNESHTKNNIDLLQSNVFLGQNLSFSNNFNRSRTLTQSASMTHDIDTSGSEWKTVVEWTGYRYNQNQDYLNRIEFPRKTYREGVGTNENEKSSWNLQSDLVLKNKKRFTIETGWRSNITQGYVQSDYLVDTGNGVRIVDRFQTNRYNYRENIHAVYGQLTRTLGKLVVKSGVRWEYTDIRGTQQVPFDTGFQIRRQDWFPYVFLKHPMFKMFGQTLQGSLIYRKSIRRPYYESLNPFPRFIDPYLYEAGNPALRPQLTDNYEFSVTFNDIPVASIGMNQTRDLFTGVIYQDTLTKIAFRTFDNLGRNEEIYGRLILGIPPGKKYFFYLGGIVNANRFNGYFQNQPLSYFRASYTFFTFHEYKGVKNWVFNAQGFLRTGGLQNFYELNTFGGMTLTINRSLLKKKANLILTVNDVFRTNRVGFRFDRNAQQLDGLRINDTRRVGLTFRYQFGFKPKEEKKEGMEAPTAE